MIWFNLNVIEKFNSIGEESFKPIFDDGFSKIFPNISKTGFTELDDKYKPKFDN